MSVILILTKDKRKKEQKAEEKKGFLKGFNSESEKGGTVHLTR